MAETVSIEELEKRLGYYPTGEARTSYPKDLTLDPHPPAIPREIEQFDPTAINRGDKLAERAVRRAINEFAEGLPNESIAANLFAGVRQGNAALSGLTANGLMIFNKAAGYLAKSLGRDTSARSGAERLEDFLRRSEKIWEPPPTTYGESTPSKVWRGVGALPSAFAEYGGAAKLLGGVTKGFAAVEALRAADEGWKQAAIEGTKGAIMGRTIKEMQPFAPITRATMLGGAGGAYAAAEGGDASDIASSALLFTGLGTLGGPGKVRFRDLYKRDPGTRTRFREAVRTTEPPISKSVPIAELERRLAEEELTPRDIENKRVSESLETPDQLARRVVGGLYQSALKGKEPPPSYEQNAWGRSVDRVLDRLADNKAEVVFNPLSGKKHNVSPTWPFRDPVMRGLGETRDPYLELRNKTMGNVYRADRMVSNVTKALYKLDPQANQLVLDYMTTPGAKSSMLPQSVRGKAVAAKSQIKKVGQELVNRGKLSQEAFDAHKDGYLHTVYLKYLMDRSPGSAQLSLEGYLKEKLDLPKEYKEGYLGEIKNAGFLIDMSLKVPARDMMIQDFLYDVSQNPKWTLPKSLVDWTPPGLETPRRVTPYWLKAEASSVRTRAGQAENSQQAQELRTTADKMDLIADNALRDIDPRYQGKVPEDFRQLPDSPRYGSMRGMIVHKDIYTDITGGQGFWVGEKGMYDKTVDKLQTATSLWKMMKVPFNPPTQIRNLVSNGILLDMAGVPAQRLPWLYKRAFSQIANNGKYYRVAVKHGIPQSTFASEELIKIQPELMRVKAEKGGLAGQLYRISEPMMKLGKGAGDLYQFSETLGKTVRIIDAMERQNMTEAQAVRAANEALFDYSLVPPLVRALRSKPLLNAPFVTFYYKSAPAMLEGALKRPQKLIKYAALPYLLGDMWVAENNNVTDEDVDKLRKALPGWLQQQGHTYLYPVRDEYGDWQYINYGYLMPWAVHTRTLRNVADMAGLTDSDNAMGTQDLIQELGIFGGPVHDVITALETGIDSFTQRPIFQESDPPAKQGSDLLNYAWRMAGPSWLTDQGVVGKYMDSQRGYTDYGDRPLTKKQALLRGVGINVYPVDPEETRQRNIDFRMGEITQLKSRQTRLNNTLQDVIDREVETLRGQGWSAQRAVRVATARHQKEIDQLNKWYEEEIERKQNKLDQYEIDSKIHPRLRKQ